VTAIATAAGDPRATAIRTGRATRHGASRPALTVSREHKLTTLPSGVRIVTEAMPSVRSAAIGIWIGSGSRGESESEAGLSHLLEHLLFKGSAKYSSLRIDQLFDAMGAELNAATDKETTAVYARVLDEHLERAFDVMADMVFRPALEEIDSERAVILEEIAMYEDDPQEKVFDVLAEAVFGEHPLGRAILGRAEVIAQTPRERIAAFHASRYVPGSVVIAAAGAVEHDALVALAADRAPGAGEHRGAPPELAPAPAATAPRRRFERKDTEQYHVCLGGRGLSRHDERRFALRVLDAVFGGSGSSRLFQEVRESRGLAYSVYSFASGYQDEGQVGIYLGTRAESLAEALSVISAELVRLQSDPAGEDELRRAKENLKGRVVLGLESTGARMCRLGSELLAGAPLLSLDELLERIEAVTLADVAELAGELWAPERLSCAGIGPDEAHLDRALGELAVAV
jgi:predicted Zn-dependent peptidase